MSSPTISSGSTPKRSIERDLTDTSIIISGSDGRSISEEIVGIRGVDLTGLDFLRLEIFGSGVWIEREIKLDST